MKAIDSILRKDVTLNFSIFALFLSNLNSKEFQISSQVGNSSPQRGERERGGEEGAKTLISLCLYRLRFLRTLSSLFPVDFDPR